MPGRQAQPGQGNSAVAMPEDGDSGPMTGMLEYFLAYPEQAPEGAIDQLLTDPDIEYDDLLQCRLKIYHLRKMDEAALDDAIEEGVPEKLVRFLEEVVEYLEANACEQRYKDMHLELRKQMVLRHLKRQRMDWKGGKKTLEQLFKRPSSDREKSQKNALLEALDNAQKGQTNKVQQLLKRHTLKSLTELMDVYLEEISARLPDIKHISESLMPSDHEQLGDGMPTDHQEDANVSATIHSIAGHKLVVDRGESEHQFYVYWTDGVSGYHCAKDLEDYPKYKK